MQVLTRVSEQYDQRIQAQAGPLVLAQELKTMDEMLANGQTSRPGRGMLSSCGGVFSQLGVMHDGTIVPCNILSTLPLGTIGIDRLQEVWLNHSTMNALRQRREIPLSSLETCQGCAYQGFCSGGCPGGAVYANDDFKTRDPMSCYRVLRGEDPFMTLSTDANNLIIGEQNG
jgi:radical SAM protein with 4Fe4S-binding SPASM domain